MKTSSLTYLAVVLGLVGSPGLWGASIVNSKHNLSATGPGTIKAQSETEICLFCHAPHNASVTAPLWNRYDSGATYTPYTSSTKKAVIGQPTGSSKLCLSCHDGTVALGMVRNRPTTLPFGGGVVTLPAGQSNLGTDLSDDHPISFTYDAALMTADGQLYNPATLTGPVRLENGQVQCTSCHDPHNDQFGKFLVKNNTASALCVTCHNRTYWTGSTHQTSVAVWNGLGANPWPHTTATTVAANACESCHRPHTAGTKPRLLNFAGEEQNCYSCHNGNVAAKNIQAEFSKLSIHNVAATTGVHDPTEDPINPPRHVECVDCHNPHAAKNTPATPPTATGRLAGVKGITAAGGVVNPLVNEYELCFRCHADSTARGPARVNRVTPQTNTRTEFNPANVSYHPVEAIGKNANVPSLIAPWTTSSLMYCTDCHNNDTGPGAGGIGPKGPHGSTYVPLLERQLVLTDGTIESAATYALCYKCHSETYLMSNDVAFKNLHNFHVGPGSVVRASCVTCHDPHGAGTAHLINFNPDQVKPNGSGLLRYDSLGVGTGRCYLSCHDSAGMWLDHNPMTY